MSKVDAAATAMPITIAAVKPSTVASTVAPV